MRLFRSSNKSQASLDNHIDSRDQSPVQNEAGYPPSSTITSYNNNTTTNEAPPPQQAAHSPPQYREPGEERYYRDNTQSPTQPVHGLTRTQSGRGPPSAIDAYAKDPLYQPTVNVVPPLSPNTPTQQARYTQAQEPVLQSPPFRGDRDKKSRRGFFGLGSRKDERDLAEQPNRPNRTPSLLKKASHQYPQSNPHAAADGQPGPPSQPQPQQQQQQQTPPPPPPPPPPAADGRVQGYSQELPGENNSADPEQYEQYYRAQSQFDGVPSAGQRPPVRYHEDGPNFEPHPPTPRHNKQPSLQSQQSQRAGYQLYHQSPSANNSSSYLHQQLQNAASNHPLRPPSPASFGPPSPLVTGVQNPDSRPPTADPQSRHLPYPSILSLSQKDLLHQRQVSQDLPRQEERDAMGRNEVSNGNSRSQRDDDRHLHYPNQQDPRIRTQSHDQGRNTPPPRNREDLATLDHHQLLVKHEELLAKYSKVKRYYFEREAQVTQLQNTVANQRLSLSKTSLDDAQYSTRFERLNGAIQNLAFNIRKDWRRVPNWLAPVCNRDACQTGTKEMTAVGRACITRWLFDFVFERIFHPGIDPNLSFHLKSIERNLRHSQYGPLLTNEQQDDLMTKIMTWRLTTIEGLGDAVSSRHAEQYQEQLEHAMTKQLNDYLTAFLVDPPPPGIPESLFNIIHQAVSLCQNIPLESRDICIHYYPPASFVNELYMKIEPSMTALSNPGYAASPNDHNANNPGDDDGTSTTSSVADQNAQSQADLEAQIREATGKGTSPNPAGLPPPRKDSMSSGPKTSMQGPPPSDKNSSREKKSSSLFGGLVNRRPAPSENSSAGPGLTMQNSDSSRSGESAMDAYNINSLTNGVMDGKIRFAAFLAVEVRGRSMLAAKDNEKGKDNDKVSMHGNDSAGTGQQANESSSGSGGSKGDKGPNVLVKAPVYGFD